MKESKLDSSYRSCLEVHNLQEALANQNRQNIGITVPRLSEREIDFISKDISSIFFNKVNEEKHKDALSAFIYFYLNEYFGGK